MSKKAFCLTGMIASVWYALSLYTTHYTQLETSLSGFAYRLYVVLMQFFLTYEAFGMVQLFILPVVFMIFGVLVYFLGKNFERHEQVLFSLPPLLMGLPTAITLFCIAAQWSPFDMPLANPQPAYLLVLSGLWFLFCLALLCRSARSHKVTV